MNTIKENNKYNITIVLEEFKIFYKRTGKGLSETFSKITPLDCCDKNSLVFCNKPDSNTITDLKANSAGVWLIEENWGNENRKVIENFQSSIFLVANPRLVAGRILSLMHPEEDYWEGGVHDTAIIHPKAIIGESVSIGAHCIVGKCSIDDNTRLGSSIVVTDDAVIGKRCIIRDFCHIGGCGFGYVRDEKTNLLTRIPHIGRAIIQDDVELFPFVNVDRGTLGDTIIKRGVKVDHYSHIGHNCTIGENTIITARAVMCGGSSIGSTSWLGVGAVIKEKVSVGNMVTVGIGAVVIDNVDDGDVVVGVPAKSIVRRIKQQQ